ncbi:hypothetical protein DL771_007103 [Monosporascus sp. 5C6A]|nr:hypothetical protein DL771_007103 [Monosporascus sp. 5C6A]
MSSVPPALHPSTYFITTSNFASAPVSPPKPGERGIPSEAHREATVMISIQDLLLPTKEGLAAKPGGVDRGRPTAAEPAARTTHFRIEFVLDTICPHCYIGLKNLTAAIQIHQGLYPGDTFDVTFSPIILDRAAGRNDDKGAYYASRGCSPFRVGQWTTLGAAAGITFRWQGKTGNTRDSHKLLRFALEDKPSTLRSTAFMRSGQPAAPPAPLNTVSAAREFNAPTTSAAADLTSVTFPAPQAAASGSISPSMPSHVSIPFPGAQPQPQPRGPPLQMRLAHAILKGYFEEDRDLSDRAFLTEVGAAATGYPAAEIRACLDEADDDDDGGGGGESGGRWGRAVDALEADVRRRGIAAVPTIIVQDRYLAGGWQEARLFVDLFGAIRSGTVPGAGPGAACGDSGVEARGAEARLRFDRPGPEC